MTAVKSLIFLETNQGTKVFTVWQQLTEHLLLTVHDPKTYQTRIKKDLQYFPSPGDLMQQNH